MNRCHACQAVNPEIAKFCMACGTPVRSRPATVLRFVTVAFCDISGSTQLALRFAPEVWHGILETYFREVGEALSSAGGRLEKFIGDAVVAVFGVDRATGDEAVAAVRGALASLERMHRVNEDLRHRHGTEVSIRFGIASGRVVAADRASSFAIGPVMNTAARLQAAAPRDGAVVDVRTWLLVRDRFRCTPTEPVAAKGFAEPLRAWVVSHGAPEPENGTRYVNQARLYERLRKEVLTAVADRRPVTVGVEGELGIGKTRLLRRLADELTGADRLADPRTGRPIPRLRVAVVPCQGDPERETLWQLQAAEDAIVRVTGDAPTGTPSLKELQWRIQNRLREAARTGPLVLLVDDYDRASPDLRRALHVDPTDHPPLPVVVAGRSLDGADAVRLRVPPLSDADAAELLTELGAEVELHSADTATLLTRAGGNPLFLEQLAVLAGAGADDKIAPSAEAALGARIDLLRPDARTVLACLGAWGPTARPHDVEAVAGLDPATFQAAWEELVAAGLTSHRVAAEVAYRRLVLHARAELHTAIANRLREYASGDPVQLDLAVSHALRAHELQRELAPGSPDERAAATLAAQCLLAAARFAITRSDTRISADLAGQARERAGDDPSLLLEAAALESYALAASGRVPAALERIRRVDGLTGNPSATAHLRVTEAALTGRTPGQARELLHGVDDPTARARLDTWEGTAAARAGDYPRAEQLLESAYVTLSRYPVGLGVAEVYANLSLFLAYGDRPPAEAVARCRRLHEETAGTPLLHATVSCALALLHQFAGDTDGALATLIRARRVFSGVGHVLGEASACQFVATVNELAGELPAARAALVEARRLYEQAGDRMNASRCALRAYLLDPVGPVPDLPPDEPGGSWWSTVLRHQALACAGGPTAERHLARAAQALERVRGRARLLPEATNRLISARSAGG